MKTTFKYFVALGAFASALFAPPMTLEQRVTEAEDRLDVIEFQSGLDKIKFGLDFSTGASESSYKITEYKNATTQKQIPEQKYSAHNKWGMELNLNMNAAINSYTKFYGRLSMAKDYGMMDRTHTNNPTDLDAGRDFRTSGQSLYVSRAYIDLFFTPEIVATLGRQPGTEGPGSNLRNNALRQSTYPALLVNALGDAAVVSYKPRFAKSLQFVVRGGYGKIYQFDEEGTVRDWISDSKNMADTDLYYAAFEVQPYLGMVGRRNLFMVSYIRLHDLALDLSSINKAIGVKNLGTIDSVNVHFESYDAFRLPLHYFVSASYMKGSNARNISFTAQVPMSAGENKPITSTQDVTTNLGKLFNEKDGFAIHAGLRYDFHRYFKLGAEYFYGSQYWFAFSRLSFNDPLNIRNTRGQAYDVYIITQLDRNQFFRLSYTHIQNKWSNRGLPLGGALGKDEKEKGGYESTADNIMLVYNVKF